MSQLLLRLESRLGSTTDSTERAELQVQRACYLARTGHFEQASEIISTVRRSHGDGSYPRISCWIMLAEGLGHFFKRLVPSANERISRAQLISVAIKDPELAALTSAWKAQVHYDTSEYAAMSKSLQTAVSFVKPDDHAAWARLALVISNCLFVCGDRVRAQKWFMKSRSHAVEAGDQATIEALMYNRAACAITWLRAETCFERQDRDLILLVKNEIVSAKNFQTLLRDETLTWIVDLWEARVLMLNEEYENALTKLRSVRASGQSDSHNYRDQLVDLEVVYCLQRLGRFDDAMLAFEQVGTLSTEGLDVDDCLVANWLFQQLALLEPRFGEPSQYEEGLNRFRVQYRESTTQLMDATNEVLIALPLA